MVIAKQLSLLFAGLPLSIKFTGTHLYSWIEKRTARVVPSLKTQYSDVSQGLNLDRSIRSPVQLEVGKTQ